MIYLYYCCNGCVFDEHIVLVNNPISRLLPARLHTQTYSQLHIVVIAWTVSATYCYQSMDVASYILPCRVGGVSYKLSSQCGWGKLHIVVVEWAWSSTHCRRSVDGVSCIIIVVVV